MTPDEMAGYAVLRDMLSDHMDATRQMLAAQNSAIRDLVERLDDNLKAQNRIIRQVANAQAQAGVLNTRVTSVDRLVRKLVEQGREFEDLLERLPTERLERWDGVVELLAPDRVKGWDDASKHVRNMRWLVTRSWKAFLAIGGSAGVAIALVLKLLGA